MQIKKFNIAKPEKYQSAQGEKTYWANVGTMTEFIKQDGSINRIIEIPAIGLKASVFEARPRENTVNTQPLHKYPPANNSKDGIPVIEENYKVPPEFQQPEGEIEVKDIPF